MSDSRVILWGEIRYWSFLEVKGLVKRAILQTNKLKSHCYGLTHNRIIIERGKSKRAIYMGFCRLLRQSSMFSVFSEKFTL